MSSEDRLIQVGVITAPHGVRGLVRVKSFTAEPEDIVAYGSLSDASGRRRIALTLKSRLKDQWLAEVEGVSDRDAAEALKGAGLYVPRAALPDIGPAEEEEDAFYVADLLGLRAEDREGRLLGQVRRVEDYGAGDIVEIATPAGGSLILPFTRVAVPVVDLEGGRIVVDPPEEVTVPPPEGEGSEGETE